MSAGPGYGREWTASIEPGRTRIRYGLTAEDGVPVRFLVQLEYRVPGRWDGVAWRSGEWRVVARFDHETSGPSYRNVEDVGLHMDVYDPAGRQRAKKADFPSVEIEQAMKRAEQYLKREHERLVRRYERWM